MKLIYIFIVSSIFITTNAYAIERGCSVKIQAKNPSVVLPGFPDGDGDGVRLVRYTVTGNEGTHNGARREARDMARKCNADWWGKRGDLIGSRYVEDLPVSCKINRSNGEKIENIEKHEVDLKSKIVDKLCPYLSAGSLGGSGPSSATFTIHWEVYGDTGCDGFYGYKPSEFTYDAVSYTVNSRMCSNGY